MSTFYEQVGGEKFFAGFQIAGALVGQKRNAITRYVGPTEREGPSQG